VLVISTKTNLEFIYIVVHRVVTSQGKLNFHSRESRKYQEYIPLQFRFS
jgi:hypothetical protein